MENVLVTFIENGYTNHQTLHKELHINEATYKANDKKLNCSSAPKLPKLNVY